MCIHITSISIFVCMCIQKRVCAHKHTIRYICFRHVFTLEKGRRSEREREREKLEQLQSSFPKKI